LLAAFVLSRAGENPNFVLIPGSLSPDKGCVIIYNIGSKRKEPDGYWNSNFKVLQNKLLVRFAFSHSSYEFSAFFLKITAKGIRAALKLSPPGE
jgi:hypothetical protein